MAEGMVITPAYVGQVVNALRKKFPGCEVEYEQLRADRNRFVMVWDGFDGMDHPERQHLVWDLVPEILEEKRDIRKVAMIITLGPEDLREDDDEME